MKALFAAIARLSRNTLNFCLASNAGYLYHSPLKADLDRDCSRWAQDGRDHVVAINEGRL